MCRIVTAWTYPSLTDSDEALTLLKEVTSDSDGLGMPELLHAPVCRINGIVITGGPRGRAAQGQEQEQRRLLASDLVVARAVSEAFDVMVLDDSPFGSLGPRLS
jgi:hypothetical protein